MKCKNCGHKIELLNGKLVHSNFGVSSIVFSLPDLQCLECGCLKPVLVNTKKNGDENSVIKSIASGYLEYKNSKDCHNKVSEKAGGRR